MMPAKDMFYLLCSQSFNVSVSLITLCALLAPAGWNPHLSVGEDRKRMEKNPKRIDCKGSLDEGNQVILGVSLCNRSRQRRRDRVLLALRWGWRGRNQTGFSLGQWLSAPRRAPTARLPDQSRGPLLLRSQCLFLLVSFKMLSL